ncbi:MAG TPA: S41 family peptidase [Gemmatimonadaceae bacterium]|nr:S41 family peptidase [Gemmatimonadaceae bacterium]
MIRRAFLSAALLTTFVASSAGCQPAGTRLTTEQRRVVLDSIASALNAMYVFPDVAARMDTDLRARAKRGEFNEVSDASSFAQQLTRDLQAISHDKHLRVRLRAADPVMGPAGSRGARSGIFGRTERMAGDVAYVEILSFGAPPEEVREATTRIMSAAADAKALIIDLRANGGGSPFTVALVSSYLFGADPVHLNSLYFRPADRTDDFFTDPLVAGRKFGPDKPIYVLTSSRTFSGAEEFAYNLQTRKRAKIVGETTGGGANPGRGVPLPYDLTVFVPTGRAINPITKTNWEGVGVKPDVSVPAANALDVALRLASQKLR